MKKIVYLLAFTVLVGTFFSSCQKDNPTVTPPTITFNTGAGFTYQDATIESGTVVKVGVVALASTSSNKNLSNFKLTLTSNNVTQTLVDSTFNSNSFQANYSITFDSTGTVRLLAVITDKAGQTAEKSFNIIIEQPTLVINKFTNISLGSYNDSEFGSFYSTTTNEVFFSNDAVSNQGKIDFEFYLGATNGATLAAPDDSTAATVFTALQDTNWVTRNATRFSTTNMTLHDFTTLSNGDSYAFPTFTGEATNRTQLEPGNIIYFKTAQGKLGYILLNNVNSRGDKINIDVIVAQ